MASYSKMKKNHIQVKGGKKMKKEYKICIGIVTGIILIFGAVITTSIFSKSIVNAETINPTSNNEKIEGFLMSHEEFKVMDRELSILNKANYRWEFIVGLETNHQLKRIADALEIIADCPSN